MANKYTYTHPVTRQRLSLIGDEEPTDADVEQAFNDVNNWRSRVGPGISGRVNLWQSLGDELSQDPYKQGKGFGASTADAYVKMARMGLLGAGAVGQSIEGAVAAPILTAQRGNINPITLLRAAKMGVTGKYPAELGDVTNELGAPEWANRIGGLALSAGLPGVAQLSRGAGKIRRLAVRGLGSAASAVGGKAEDVLGAVGRIDPGLTAYGKKTNYKFITPGQSMDSITDDLLKAEEKARRVTLDLKKKASADFGSAVKPYNTRQIPLVNKAGASTGADVTNELLSEGKLFWEPIADDTGAVIGRRLRATPAGDKLAGMRDIADYLDALNNAPSGKLDGGTLRTMVEGLMENYPDNAFANRLATDIRDTMGRFAPDLDKATKDYARRHYLLYGEKAGSTGALTVTKESPTGATTMGNLLTGSTKTTSQAARRRAVLEAVEKEAGQNFTDELYDAIANMQYSRWNPSTQLSLAGAATAAGGVAMGNPQLATSAVIAALALSPRGQALTQKGINTVRSKAIQLSKQPVVQRVTDLIERGVIDPGMARAMTGRNRVMEE